MRHFSFFVNYSTSQGEATGPGKYAREEGEGDEEKDENRSSVLHSS